MRENQKKNKSIFEKEFYASETRYRRLFESAKDGILILDAETGKIVDVNPFLIDLLGYSKKEFIEKSIWEIGAFKDSIENKDKFLELQQSEYVRYDDLPLVTSDGREIYVEFVSNVYLVENHKVIQCQIRDITARKETEAILERTGKELAEIKKTTDEINKFTENIIDTVREPLLAIDKDLRVIKASRSFYHFFKVTAEETIGKLIYELGNHQWDIPKLKELLEEIIPEKNTFDNYEVEHNFSTIGKRVMLLNARQVKRAFGKEQVILLAIEDITERKGKEDALKETHRATSEFLNILLNHLHTPIIIWDTSMIIKRFNRKFELLSGYNSAKVIGKKIDFLFPKEKIAATLELLKNHLDGEQEVIEIDILTKDNNIKTVLWNSSRILDEEGKNIVATISQDITSRRQSELALRKSESHLRALIKTIPDLIWMKDTNGMYLSCNPMFERFFGARETDIIGKTDYNFVDRELAGFFRENDRKAMEAGKPTSNEEWVTFADDGHRAFLDTIKSPIYDSDGTLLGILGIGRDITERKLAEQKVRASEKRFRAIFDQSPIATALIDFQGHPILSNSRISKMLGYTKDELSKMKFTEFTYPEDIDKDLNQFTDLIAGKISGYNMEKRYIHKNGNLIWANLSVTALNDNNNVPQEIIAMVEDITGQKKFQNEIKFQADLINNVGQAVIATDLQGKVIYWNNAAEQIYGWSPSEAIGQNIMDLTPARQTNEQAIEIMKELSAGKSWAGEFEVKRKDRSSFPAFVTDTPILDSNGKLTGIIGISSDITERKQIQQKLKESEEEFRIITENSADAIFITDKEGKYLYVNKQAVDLLGYSKEELLKSTIAEISPKNRIEEYFQIFQKLFITGSSYSEIELVKKDGSYADTDLNAVLLPNGWIYGSCRDISKRKKLENELIKAREKAEENDRLKSAFLANMSHEIRTPMNGILGFTGLLKNHGLSGDEQQEYIKIIEKSGARMLNIINDIISISKIESHQTEIKNSDTNINEQLEYIYRFLKVEAEQKNLHLALKNGLLNEDSIIRTDSEKVSSVLTNLVKNAIKFTQTGLIELGYLKKDEFLEFYIKDSGPGIPEKHKKIIFERFRQGSEALNRNYEGAGLGLSISKAYVEMLGGKMWVENNAERDINASGTTFFFTIPVSPPEKVDAFIPGSRKDNQPAGSFKWQTNDNIYHHE